MGDFNLPGIEWSREDDQLIGIPSNNTTLDLVLVNSDNVKVYEEPYHLVSPDGHHPPISFNLSIVSTKSLELSRVWKYNFRRVCYNDVNEYFASFDWENVLDSE
ncbi:hypothetical protein QE152_g1966 [Popillia japonica]|uniref:Endonuclease/exonuclease/phosphatase domain-containing protein n=1 Tax=Popillia japonica TaxID=7064 RepID=A0AAW1N535_POPJA